MRPIKIFISSVQNEFANERVKLCDYIRQDALLGKFFMPFIFEELPAVNISAQNAYVSEVERSDIYLGIFGETYGFEDKEGISPTEREYDKATELSKYRLTFIRKHDINTVHPKEQAFISKIESNVVRKSFSIYEDLRNSVYAALVHYLEENEYLRLLPFDATTSYASIDDIDEEKTKKFIRRARYIRNFPLTEETSPAELLTHLNLLKDGNKLTNAAILLFGKQPQQFFITSEIKCAQFYGYEIQKPMHSYQVYRGDVFELIDQAVAFVMSRINARVGARDKGIVVDVDYELPIGAVTESIVNAVAHRDYTSNASIQVMLFKDRLEIWSPGFLPMGMTIEKLSKPHNSIPTNPLLANPMYLAGTIERMGTGTRDIIAQCKANDLKDPKFIQDDILRLFYGEI